MQFWGDDRAQSVQVGAILLFGILMIALATYQVAVVPQENAQVEFNHNQEVQSDMVDLRGSILESASAQRSTTSAVRLGTTYPARSVFVNPGPPSGRLDTVGTNDPAVNVTIQNASSTDADIQSYWNGSERRYMTGAIVYNPNYNEFRSPPETGVDNGVTYNRQEERTVAITGQRLIDGDEINVVTLVGNLSRNGISASVDLKPVSASDNVVTLDGSEDISLTISTRLNNETWSRMLEDEPRVERTELVDGNGSFNRVRIDLEENGTYRLRASKIGVGTGQDAQSEAAYIVATEGDGSEVVAGGTTKVGFELRDGFNNPTGGVVNVSVNEGCLSVNDGVCQETVETLDVSSDGRIDLTYDAAGVSPGDVLITANTTSGDRVVEAQSEVTVYASGAGNQSGENPSWYRSYLQWDVDRIDNVGGEAVQNISATCQFEKCISYSGTAGSLDMFTSSGDLSFVSVSYRANDSAIVEGFEPNPAQTNDSGVNRTTATLGEQTGWVELQVQSVNSYDILYLNITDGSGSGGGGSSDVPGEDENGNEYNAFNDRNGNGLYNEGEERYTDDDLKQFQNSSVDLVISEDIGSQSSRITGNGVNIQQANSFTLTEGSTIWLQNNFDIENNVGDITVQGTIDTGGARIRMRPTGSIDLDGSVLRSDGSVILESQTSDGSISAVGAMIDAENRVEFTTVNGDINLEDATVSGKNQRTATINGNGDIYVSGLGVLDPDGNGAVMTVSVPNADQLNGEDQVDPGSVQLN